MRATCALLAISPWPLPPAQRIVVLAPSLTELMFAAGADSRLVGVARFSDYPSAAKNIPLIGDASRIDLESILSLAPDLIVVWKSGNQIADLDRLEQLGFKAYVAELDTLTAISKSLRRSAPWPGLRTPRNARIRARHCCAACAIWYAPHGAGILRNLAHVADDGQWPARHQRRDSFMWRRKCFYRRAGAGAGGAVVASASNYFGHLFPHLIRVL
jgi:hypothetical protein